MTFARLKWIGVLAPVLFVIALEVARYLILGVLPIRQRLLLDLFAVATFIALYFILFSALGDMQRQLRRQNQELLALHGAGLDVASELALDAVLEKVVEQARNLVGARYGALSVINREGWIESFVTSGISDEARTAIGPPPVGHGLLGVVLREGQTLRMKDLTKDPRSHGFPPNHPPMKSLLAVPILCREPFVGNLYLAEKNGADAFTADDQETLGRFAVQAAIAIDNAHLHRKAGDLAVAQERLRIAHEMHDGLAQVLGYVNTKVQAAKEYLKTSRPDEANDQLEQLAVAARNAYADVRQAIVGLRTLPESRISLIEALQEYVDRWKEQSGISTQLIIDGSFTLEPRTELQLIRIVQEALTNVRKHAKATTARVDLRARDGVLVVTVRDNGIGFDPATSRRGEFPRFGLPTMRERAEATGGTLQIEATPGGGTVIEARIPLEPGNRQ
ncbi:MAG TPA: GAF domain-containing sensor histidine kinase [Thermoanaerobaculia bacterium]